MHDAGVGAKREPLQAFLDGRCFTPWGRDLKKTKNVMSIFGTRETSRTLHNKTHFLSVATRHNFTHILLNFNIYLTSDFV